MVKKSKAILSLLLVFCVLLSCLSSVLLPGALAAVTPAASHSVSESMPENWQFKGDIYNDFDDSSVTQVYTGGGSIATEDGRGNVFKYDTYSDGASGTVKSGNLVLNPTGTASLKDLGYSADDVLHISFKGKRGTEDEGRNNYYGPYFVVRTHHSQSKADWDNDVAVASNYFYNGRTYNTWANKTISLDLDNIVYSGAPVSYDSEATSIFLQLTTDKAVGYLDDIMIYRTTALTVEDTNGVIVWGSDPFEYAVGSTYDPANARVGDWYTFTLNTTESMVVTYGDDMVVPTSGGQYAIKVEKGKTLKVDIPEYMPVNWQFKGDVYNDFDDSSVTQVYTGGGSIVAEEGRGNVYKFDTYSDGASGTVKSGNLVLNPTGTASLKDLGYAADDVLHISFKGKRGTEDEGRNNYYGPYFVVRTHRSQSNVDWDNDVAVASNYFYNGRTYNTWANKTISLDLDNIVYNGSPVTYDSEATSLFLQLTTDKAVGYLDDIMIYRTTAMTVEDANGVITWGVDPFEYAAVGSTYDPANARVGDWYTFTVNSNYDATVTYGGVPVTPSNDGIYAIKVEKGFTLKVESTKKPTTPTITEIVQNFETNTVVGGSRIEVLQDTETGHGKVASYDYALDTSNGKQGRILVNPQGMGTFADLGITKNSTFYVTFKYRQINSKYTFVTLAASTSQTSLDASGSVQIQATNTSIPGKANEAANKYWCTQTLECTMPDTATSEHVALKMILTSSNGVDANLYIDDIIISTTQPRVVMDVTATSSDTNGGTAVVSNKDTEKTDIANGETAQFKATVKDGYAFSKWVDSVGNTVSTDAEFEAVVASDMRYTAVFKEIKAITEINTDFANTPATDIISGNTTYTNDAEKGTVVEYSSVGSNGTAKQGRIILTGEEIGGLDQLGVKAGDTIYLMIPFKKTTDEHTWFRVDAGVGHTISTFQAGSKQIQVGDSTFTGDKGTWQTKVLAITLPDNFTSEHVALRFLISDADSAVLIGNVKISLTKPEEPKKELTIKTPQDEVIIDYDNYGGNANFNETHTHKKVLATGYDGKQSYMFHSDALDRSATGRANILNYSDVMKDQDHIYTIPVKPNTTYDVSFRIKLSEQGELSNWFQFSVYQNGNETGGYSVLNTKRGEWVECKFTCTTIADYDRMSFYFNAGSKNPEFWLDDIRIAVSPLQKFEGWGTTPKDEYVITFDDWAVPLKTTVQSRMSVEKAPARDGKATNAMHVFKGHYNSVTFINWDTVSTNTDPVFSMPVKPNTMYEYSVWVYIDQTDPMEYIHEYCAFIADQNQNLSYSLKNNNIRGEWQQIKLTFVTAEDQYFVSTSINFNMNPLSIWFDDVTLKEVKAGVLANIKETYCEEVRNLLSDEDIADIESGKSGAYKVEMLPSQQYVFGVEASTKNTASKSRIFLSEDGINPVKASVEGVTDSVITPKDGNLTRYGYRVLSPSTGYMYIVVENNDNALSLKVPQLFKNHLITNLYFYGLDYNPNVLKQPTYDTLIELNTSTDPSVSVGQSDELLGSESDNSDSSNEETNEIDSESPETGENTVLPAVMLFVAAIAVLVLTLKIKRGEQE